MEIQIALQTSNLFKTHGRCWFGPGSLLMSGTNEMTAGNKLYQRLLYKIAATVRKSPIIGINITRGNNLAQEGNW